MFVSSIHWIAGQIAAQAQGTQIPPTKTAWS
jgi:hypothetical protein